SIKRFAAFRLLDDNLALTTGPRAGNANRLLLDVFALRIVRTRNKLSKAPEALHQLRSINRTLLIERHGRRCNDSSLPDLPDVATLRISGAAEKWSKASAL